MKKYFALLLRIITNYYGFIKIHQLFVKYRTIRTANTTFCCTHSGVFSRVLSIRVNSRWILTVDGGGRTVVDKGQKVVKPVYSPSSHDLEAHLCAYKKLDIYIIAQFLTIWWLKVDEYILLSNLSQNRGNCPTNSLPRVNRKTSRACASERARVQNSFLTRTRSRPCRAHARHKHAHKIHVVTRHRHAFRYSSHTPAPSLPIRTRAYRSLNPSAPARLHGYISFDNLSRAGTHRAQNRSHYLYARAAAAPKFVH